MNLIKKAAAVAATATLAGAAVALAAAGTANAGPAPSLAIGGDPIASHCHKSSKTFNLPNKPDMTVTLELCIDEMAHEGNTYWFRADIDYAKWSASPYIQTGKRFNYFHVYASARNANSGRVVPNQYGNTFNFNASPNGYRYYSPQMTGWADTEWASPGRSGWYATANAYVDISGDGKPAIPWHLQITGLF